MSTNREKTSSIMGFVMSLLLHGIFFAGCIAIDFTFHQDATASNTTKTEISKTSNHMDVAKAKS
jgi:hypothetical protein